MRCLLLPVNFVVVFYTMMMNDAALLLIERFKEGDENKTRKEKKESLEKIGKGEKTKGGFRRVA